MSWLCLRVFLYAQNPLFHAKTDGVGWFFCCQPAVRCKRLSLLRYLHSYMSHKRHRVKYADQHADLVSKHQADGLAEQAALAHRKHRAGAHAALLLNISEHNLMSYVPTMTHHSSSKQNQTKNKQRRPHLRRTCPAAMMSHYLSHDLTTSKQNWSCYVWRTAHNNHISTLKNRQHKRIDAKHPRHC